MRGCARPHKTLLVSPADAGTCPLGCSCDTGTRFCSASRKVCQPPDLLLWRATYAVPEHCPLRQGTVEVVLRDAAEEAMKEEA